VEYYLQKEVKLHHDRSVAEEVSLEIIQKLDRFPEHLRLMFLHLWCVGLRISEVCSLKGNTYYRQGEDAWMQVYQVKMRTYKRIPIPDTLFELMQVYIKKYEIGPDEYLFRNRKGGAFSYGTFRWQMVKFCNENQIENGEYIFKSHDYRHTVATMFYDNDVSIQSIRDYLGHNYEEMTQQYIDYMPRKIAEANDSYFADSGSSLATGLKIGGKHGK
jgi:integrase